MIVKLLDAIEGQEYVIQDIETDDEELDAFLFSLGCYSGETITVVTHLKVDAWFLLKTLVIRSITSLPKQL